MAGLMSLRMLVVQARSCRACWLLALWMTQCAALRLHSSWSGENTGLKTANCCKKMRNFDFLPVLAMPCSFCTHTFFRSFELVAAHGRLALRTAKHSSIDVHVTSLISFCCVCRIPGASLDAVVPLTRALALASQQSLHAVHAMGYVHGDLHLGNFVVVEGSQPTSPLVKVIDFGLARPAGGDEVEAEETELVRMFAGEVSSLEF